MNFKNFFEQQNKEYDSMSIEIPLPEEVQTLAELFKLFGEELFVVGGAVRDKLYNDFHNQGKSYKPKDVDLATSANPDKVLEVLNSKEAQRKNIKSFPKGIAFGVVSAIVNKQEFEIATFREEWYDPTSGDGRRPDRVSFSTPANDAKRRDLNINALFYDINSKKIRDYNMDSNGIGMGIQDIKNKIVRPVGKAEDRFKEDKLRVLRLVRFFCRVNDGDITKYTDKETINAINKFKTLEGVSNERIAMEFLAGLKQCLDPVMFLKNYYLLDLFDATFPSLSINNKFDNVKNIKNPIAVIAWILKDNDPKKVNNLLNKAKFSSDIFENVVFLLNLNNITPEKLVNLLRRRDLHKQEKEPELQQLKNQQTQQNVRDFANISGKTLEMSKFLNYSPIAKSADFMHLKPQERGKAMSAAEIKNYYSQ